MTRKDTKSEGKKYRVLFLCTGNSARSQMAEAIVNHQHGENWHAVSAGTKPKGHIYPHALQVLEEIGITHQGMSKDVAQFKGETFDMVVTVCDHAKETCPLWLGEGTIIHRGYRDPAEAKRTEEEILSVFRYVRDQIRDQIPPLLAVYQKDRECIQKREESHD